MNIKEINLHPRNKIEKQIQNNELNELMTGAALIHGHYCPGLAMGIIASAFAMKKINSISDGLEDIIAITETNNCFSDGIQYVTGCTFGNNGLIFKDFGKTAFTLTKRDGKGIRLIASEASREKIRQVYPEFTELYQKVVKEKNHDKKWVEKFKSAGIKRAFATLQISVEEIFNIEYVNIKIPDYAPSHSSLQCVKCNESVMSTRINEYGICLSCFGKEYYQLDGHGISKK